MAIADHRSLMHCLATLVLAGVISAAAYAADDDLIVSTAAGKIRGIAEDGIQVFKNIPFAAPPVGDLRWRAPQPAPAWPGVRDGSEYGAVCPQPLVPNNNKEVLSPYPMSEDCLNLNVWTSQANTDARKPVMLWILPGSFKFGAGQMPRYNGAGLARQDRVVVTFNYRLGILGQFAHPALGAGQPNEPLGNYNFMDQIAALRWVRDNIARFGGDPDNVTIFGMSAGGVSVNYLMAIPAARGLFHRAISQSSGIRISAPRHISRDAQGGPSLESDGRKMATAFNINDGDIAAQLRALSWQQLLEYQDANPPATGSMNPVVDEQLIVEGVGAAFRAGRQAPVPYIAGATSWEGSLLSWLSDADLVLKNFRMSRADAARLYGDVDERQLIDNLEVDFFFGSQRYLVKQHAASGYPAYLYFFSRVLEAQLDELPGAAHGAETRYALKTLDTYSGPAKMAVFGTRVLPSDHAYADIVSAYWADFADSGNPNGGDRPSWPLYGLDGADRLLEFAQQAPVERTDFRVRRMEYFENHFETGKL